MRWLRHRPVSRSARGGMCANKRASQPSGSPQSLLCGFAKQTEKESEIGGKACFHIRTSDSFSINCHDNNAANERNDWFLCYFLWLKESNVSPPVVPYTSSLPSHSFTFGTSSSFATVGAISRMDVPCSSLPSANFGPQMHTGIVISSGVSVPWLRSWPP